MNEDAEAAFQRNPVFQRLCDSKRKAPKQMAEYPTDQYPMSSRTSPVEVHSRFTQGLLRDVFESLRR